MNYSFSSYFLHSLLELMSSNSLHRVLAKVKLEILRNVHITNYHDSDNLLQIDNTRNVCKLILNYNSLAIEDKESPTCIDPLKERDGEKGDA